MLPNSEGDKELIFTIRKMKEFKELIHSNLYKHLAVRFAYHSTSLKSPGAYYKICRGTRCPTDVSSVEGLVR